MIFWIVLVFNLEKCGNFDYTVVSFLDVTSSCFQSLGPCLKFTSHNVAENQVTNFSLVLKDSDTES